MTTKESLTLQAQPRHTLGKGVRLLRRQGLTPANLYGRGIVSTALQVSALDLERTLTSGGRNALLALSINGVTRQALLRGLQRHPTTHAILHADFYQVEMDRPIVTQVPIHLMGEAPAARRPDAVITQVLHALEVESLPADIPAAIEADLSLLIELDTALFVRDLRVPPGVTVLADAEQPVVRAARARAAEEVVPAPEAAPEEEAPEEGEEAGREE